MQWFLRLTTVVLLLATVAPGWAQDEAPERIDWQVVERVLDFRLPGPGKATGRSGEPTGRKRHALARLAARIRGYDDLMQTLTPSQAAGYTRPGSQSGRK